MTRWLKQCAVVVIVCASVKRNPLARATLQATLQAAPLHSPA